MILQHEYLHRLTRDIFKACGAPEAEAEIVAEHLVEANLMGLDSHGIVRVPQYVNAVKEDTIRPGAPVTILRESPTTAIVDAGLNFGQVGATRAMDVAMEKARLNAVGCVVVRRCNHVGRVGAYPQMAAEKGFIGMAVCSSVGGGHFVCPWGGRKGRLATNPIAFAAPSEGDPLLVDVSTSMASEGKIRIKRSRGESLPKGWIMDADGHPSTDPKDFYGPPMGAIMPLGGSAGYKGYAFSLMVEILGGVLLDEGYTPTDIKEPVNGLWLMVLDISAYMGKDRFKQGMHDLVEYLKSSPLAEGSSEITVPGEIDFRCRERRKREGIPVEDGIWRQIEEVAEELNVEL